MRSTLGWSLIVVSMLLGCASVQPPRSCSCFGIPCEYSGRLTQEEERAVPEALRGAFHVESVQDIGAAEIAGQLEHKRMLAEEVLDGVRYVALEDHRCVTFGSGVSGMMIVVERYRVK